MAGKIVNEETKLKKKMLTWADDLAGKVIQAALEDAALRFLDDIDDEEQVDLQGEYDPIVNEQTGAKLSDAIEEFAAKIKHPEKVLRRVYLTALKRKWQARQSKIPTDPHGQTYGAYVVNSHGVWSKLRVSSGLDGLFVWRRIARTRIDPVAMSRDTTPQRNWRRRYLITDGTGQFAVEIGNEDLAKKADRAIRIFMRRGVHVVETAGARQKLAKFLRFRPRARIIRAPSVGWFEPKKGSWVFVLPNETLGDGKVNVTLDDAIGSANERRGFHRSGTLQEWQQEVPAPLAGNSNVILDVGIFSPARCCAGATNPAAVRREIEQRRQTIAATVKDRFSQLSLKDRRLVAASAAEDAQDAFDGYVKDGHLLVFPKAWHRILAGLDADAVKQRLLRDGLLLPDGKGQTPSLEKYGEKSPKRFYVLAPAFVERA